MDPLSDLLSLLKPRSHVSAGFAAGGDWSLAFSHNPGIKCYAVVSGHCWMAVDGVPEALRLEAGDCYLLPRGRPFRLASDLALPAVDAGPIFAAVSEEGGVVRYQGGSDFFLVGSRFSLAGQQAGMLLEMLPPVVHLRDKSEQATLRWYVERMMQELRDQQPGGLLVAQHLAHMMLVQALRLHISQSPRAGAGWLQALADPQIGAALAAIHRSPAQAWTLETLAEQARMSRSAFALKFKQKAGTAPIDYLTRWRMLLAADRLEHSGEPISAISRAVGYESESAFSTAFKRVMGRSPRRSHRDR